MTLVAFFRSFLSLFRSCLLMMKGILSDDGGGAFEGMLSSEAAIILPSTSGEVMAQEDDADTDMLPMAHGCDSL